MSASKSWVNSIRHKNRETQSNLGIGSSSLFVTLPDESVRCWREYKWTEKEGAVRRAAAAHRTPVSYRTYVQTTYSTTVGLFSLSVSALR